MTHLRINDRHDREAGNGDEVGDRDDPEAPTTGLLKCILQWTLLPHRMPFRFRKDYPHQDRIQNREDRREPERSNHREVAKDPADRGTQNETDSKSGPDQSYPFRTILGRRDIRDVGRGRTDARAGY